MLQAFTNRDSHYGTYGLFPMRSAPPSLRSLVRAHWQWEAWGRLIARAGITIDRPRHKPHPRYPEIIYPLDYGYVNGTLGTDGDAVDVFVGTATTGLVGAILTTDYRQQDREAKLLFNCTPAEVYTAHGFINFDRELLEGLLVLRRPMHELWDEARIPT
jgi:inorganic pyrophosphatase